jgi:hypothetical protein
LILYIRITTYCGQSKYANPFREAYTKNMSMNRKKGIFLALATVLFLIVSASTLGTEPGPGPGGSGPGTVNLKINGLDANVEFHSGDAGSIGWTSNGNCSDILGYSSPNDPFFDFGKLLSNPVGSQGTSPITVNTTYQVDCEDADFNVDDTDSVNVIALPDLLVSCSASPTSITAGQSATWSSSVSGGAGNYTYSWSGTDGLSGSGPSVVKQYNNAVPPAKSASLTVTSIVNSGVNRTKTAACSNTVSVSPANSSPVADAGLGHNVTVDIEHAHDGATASDVDNNLASYLWEFDGCPGSCPSSFTQNESGGLSGGATPVSVPEPKYTPTAPGGYRLKLTVRDTDGASATSLVTDNSTAPGGEPPPIPGACNGGTDDAKLRLYQNGIRQVAVSTSNVSKLKVYRNNTIYSVVLVDPNSGPNASKMRVFEGGSIKAVCILNPS